MPVVHIRGNARATTEGLANVARVVGSAAGCSTGDVWCTYEQVTTTVGTRTGAVVHVHLLMQPRPADVLEETLAAAARAASESFRVPLADVWAHLTVLETGRVFAGGETI